MVCKQCQTENETGSKFCKNCGAPLQPVKSEFKKLVTKKTSPILMISAILLVFAILFIGREYPKLKPTTVTLDNYNLTIPGIYKPEKKKNVITITSDQFDSNEYMLIQLYPDNYQNVINNFNSLKYFNKTVTEVNNKGSWTYVKYKTDNYLGIVAVTKAKDNKVFWIQSIAASYKRGEELVEKMIPIIEDALKN